MRVRTNLSSNLIFKGKVYPKNFMDEIDIPDDNTALVAYVKANSALFPQIAAPVPFLVPEEKLEEEPVVKKTVKNTLKSKE